MYHLVQQTPQGSTSSPVTFPSNVTAGNLLVVVASRQSHLGNPPGISDSLGDSWSQIQFAQGASIPPFGTAFQISVLQAVASSTGSCTITMPVTGGTSGPDAFFGFEFSNVDSVDGSSTGGTSAPSVTTTKAGDLILTVLGCEPGNAALASVSSPEVIIQTVDTLFQGTAIALTQTGVIGSVTSTLTDTGSPTTFDCYICVALKIKGLTSSVRATAYPDVGITSAGGVSNSAFSSVLGSIRLGLWQLGAVPVITPIGGKGSFTASAFPDVLAIPPRQLLGSFTLSAYPDCSVRGNKGPLLVVFSAFPDCDVAGLDNVYADGSFECAPFPDVTVRGVATGGVVFSAFPDVILSPIVGQPVSCVVGPAVPPAVIENYAY
jgi:hypothetical protein